MVKKINLTKEKLEELYKKKNYSQIAKDYGVNPEIIRLQLHKYGIKMTPSKWLSISKRGNKNPNWKGNWVGYNGLHGWVRRNKPKPEFCECCEERQPYDLANISGKYKRDVNDYEWLCRRCHMTKDERMKNLKERGKKHPAWKGGLPKCLDCNKLLSRHSNVQRCRKCCSKMRKRDEKGVFV